MAGPCLLDRYLLPMDDPRAVDVLIQGLQDRALAVRKAAAESPVRLYTSTSQSDEIRVRILAQRDTMAKPHKVFDMRALTWYTSDRSGFGGLVTGQSRRDGLRASLEGERDGLAFCSAWRHRGPMPSHRF